MAYPPTVPPNARANGTANFDNHPDDHNALADALTDIISELGSAPKGAWSSVTARLARVLRADTGRTSPIVVSAGEVSSGSTDGSGDFTVTFPETFSSAPVVVVGPTTSAVVNRIYHVASVTTSGFTVRMLNPQNGAAIPSSVARFSWIAYGVKNV